MAAMAAALTSCVAEDAPATDEAVSPVLSTVGIERIIPVHYYVLDNSVAPCAQPTTTADIYEGIRIANRGWQQAGIQFTVSRIDRLSSAWHFQNIDNVTTWAWTSVYAQLQAMDPTLTSTTFTGSQTNEAWLGMVADRLSYKEIPMMVPCTEAPGQNNGHSSYPWFAQAHVIHIPPPMIGNSTVSHELGHYFGLIHTFEVGGDDSDYDQYFGVDGSTVAFFTSTAQVTAWRASGKPLLRKDGRLNDRTAFDTGPANCSYLDVNTCEMQCTFGPNTYRTSTAPAALRGISHAVAGGPKPYATNVMSYFWCPGSPPTSELKDLEPSGIEKVRATLRATLGQRDQLGRGSVRQGPKRSSTVDFDGDHKRDLAYFRPSTSQCVVRYSTDNTEHTITIAGGDATLGDTPMLGDYDGDGKTDCAVYRPGTDTAPAYWLWTASSAGFATQVDAFGERGDIPVSDIHLPSTGTAFGRYAIYRPSTGQVWWRESATSARWVAWGGGEGDELVLGDYDRDGWTDLAAWAPKLSPTSGQAQLKITYSANNFATSRAFNFGLETDVPIGAVSRDGDGALDFAVWRPSNGTWYYLLNPRIDGSSGYLETAWGLPGDVPMPGFDLDGDGRDDEAIWRPAGSGAQIWFRKTATTTYAAIGMGQTGDVPMFVPDTNGDGMAELVLFRPSGAPEGRYFKLDSSGGTYPWYAPVATSMTYTDIEL